MRKTKALGLAVLSTLLLFLSGCDLVVFDPKGPQAKQILDLINWTLVWVGILFAIVVGMFAYFVWKYRANNKKANYDPEEKGNHVLEVVWTLIPIAMCIILLVPNSKVLFALEDFPEEYQDQEPITIHVTSADWKWIFSYPEQNIETVNYVIMPVNTPVNFKMTSAGTMQSFWIPSLAGQKYTMANMEVELPVVAEVPGSYWGKNTNFNGEGYYSQEFEVIVQTQEEFDSWVKDIQERAPKLTEEEYYDLLQPSILGQTKSYSNTHLDWVDHADHSAPSTKYLSPEKYLHDYEYPGQIFDIQHQDEDDSHAGHGEDSSNDEQDEHGGDHSGH